MKGVVTADGVQLEYFCDNWRHLVCKPYTPENLHIMAADLGIKSHWFHADKRHPHYDIPLKRFAEIQARCTVVSQRDILRITKGL